MSRPAQGPILKFLVKDNRYSALCITCHQIPGGRARPSPPRRRRSSPSCRGRRRHGPPTRCSTNGGAETCHTPTLRRRPRACSTSAAGPPASRAPRRLPCLALPACTASPERGIGERVDIGRQVRKVSAHHESPGFIGTSLRAAEASRGSGSAGSAARIVTTRTSGALRRPRRLTLPASFEACAESTGTEGSSRR